MGFSGPIGPLAHWGTNHRNWGTVSPLKFSYVGLIYGRYLQSIGSWNGHWFYLGCGGCGWGYSCGYKHGDFNPSFSWDMGPRLRYPYISTYNWNCTFKSRIHEDIVPMNECFWWGYSGIVVQPQAERGKQHGQNYRRIPKNKSGRLYGWV